MFKDPIFASKRKYVIDYYPKSNGSIYGNYSQCEVNKDINGSYINTPNYNSRQRIKSDLGSSYNLPLTSTIYNDPNKDIKYQYDNGLSEESKRNYPWQPLSSSYTFLFRDELSGEQDIYDDYYIYGKYNGKPINGTRVNYNKIPIKNKPIRLNIRCNNILSGQPYYPRAY